jgi:Bacterial Ig domain/Bacterial cadherin-like domain
MPTARADSVTTNANTAVKIAVLANDTGPSLKILSVTVPANGSATINTDKTITYTPKTGYTGSDSFQYTIRDGAGKKATGTVSITVRNQAPVPSADSAATDAGTPVTIAVLANDSDPDGHALKINAVTQPANGAAAINPDKTSPTRRRPASPVLTASATRSATATAAPPRARSPSPCAAGRPSPSPTVPSPMSASPSTSLCSPTTATLTAIHWSWSRSPSPRPGRRR